MPVLRKGSRNQQSWTCVAEEGEGGELRVEVEVERVDGIDQ